MKKVFFEFITLGCLFLTMWLLLANINWVSILKVEKITSTTEEKVGELFWKVFKNSETEITRDSIINPIDSILNCICEKNGIDRKKIKLHLLKKDEINAITLPNYHMVIYSGLIEECEKPEELAGVMCHEIAHMEKNHVMNKLVKEYGLSMLISISSGSGNTETIKEALKHLTSSAYDRKLESEADLTAVDYLINADINPEPIADFLYRLSNGEIPREVYWISTHPDSRERAEKILAYFKDKDFKKTQILDNSSWNSLKQKISEE